jgi:hypothetical protein
MTNLPSGEDPARDTLHSDFKALQINTLKDCSYHVHSDISKHGVTLNKPEPMGTFTTPSHVYQAACGGSAARPPQTAARHVAAPPLASY